MLSAIRSSSKASIDSLSFNDTESERKVSQAAGRLGKDIQQIIVMAKAGGQSSLPSDERKGGADFENDAWKTRLLQILGGTDIDVEQLNNPYANSDVDVILQNSTCDKFIHRCLENELPPNLIHCLRLLRVLELQAAHSYARLQRNVKNSVKNTNSVSRSATEKVMQLLIMLCKDVSVGEQLKPHLFGLLALPGASYPPNGMHIARAATEIIVAFSRFCLSPPLAMFLHDRKVILNMTDDVKELCGLIEASNLTSGSLCLYGESAEDAGLWVVGLRAIVYLVHASCYQQCVDILRDFYDSGGLELLTFAIWNSRTNNVKKLLELVATLTYCKLETGLSRGEQNNSSSNFLNDLNKPPTRETSSGEYGLASNPGAFQLIEDLMVRSVPLLRKYNEFYKSKITIQKGTSLTELAKISLDISAELHILAKMKDQNEAKVYRCNELASELLVSTLQIYSDHPRNYSIIEDKYHVLALYLLSFTSFTDVSTKVLILKTLEYVCTGLSDISPVIPLQITCEILLAMSKYHLRLSVDDESIKSHEELLSRYSADCSLLLEVLEKLAIMGPSVRDVLVAIGIFDEHFDEFSSTIMSSLSQDQQSVPVFNFPPVKTSFDEPFISICRLLNISLHVSAINNESGSRTNVEGSLTLTGQSRDLNLLINAGVCEMGENAADAALSTLGTKMSFYTSVSQLQIDMLFLMQLSIHFSELILRAPSAIELNRDNVMNQLISRQCSILKTFSSVLTNNRDAIHSFRVGLGFNIILRSVGSLHGAAQIGVECFDSALKMIQISLEVLSVALTLKEYLEEGTSPEDYMGPACNRDNFFEKFAESLIGTGMLSLHPYGELIVKCALHVIEPSLLLVKGVESGTDEKVLSLESAFAGSLRNPDAVALVLCIAVRMPTDMDLSCDAINTVYTLCLIENSRSYSQIASIGLCRKLIESMLRINARHKLYHPLYRLFKKILSMRMNYGDFLFLIRLMIWPLFSKDGGRLPLPKIGSKDILNISDAEVHKPDQRLTLLIQCMSEIAEEGTRSAAMKLGGGSISSIAYEIQKGRIEERLQGFAKEGGTTFVQLNTVESSSHSILSTQTLGANMAVADNLWSATSSSGFSYSLWIRVPYRSSAEGNMFLFDVATSPDEDTNRLSRTHYEYLSLFYDIKKEAFIIITSSSPKPTILSCTPLAAGWHHVLFSYQPAKRSMLSRKALIGLAIDGRALDGDIKIDPVILPSKSRIYIGVPNPVLIISGIVSGPLLIWEMGSILLFSTVLSARDATSIYLYGPDYEGNFWGDSPQRLSLSSHATIAFATLSIMKRHGGVLNALEKCGINDLESSSHSSMENRFLGAYYEDSLSSMGLSFQVNPDAVIAAYRLSSHGTIAPNERCLYNVARVSLSESTATDANGFGVVSITIPQSMSDNVRWGGGPSIFFPFVVSSISIEQLILSLRLIRSSIYLHVPNIDYMQTGGGYRMLAYFLKEKNLTDLRIVDECFGFATNIALSDFNNYFERCPDQLVLIDLEAMKSLLLNQHVWDLQRGPGVSLHLNSRLNILITPGAVNSPFNARRMHQVGIVPFTLDLMLEAAKMYNLGYLGAEEMKKAEYRSTNLLNAVSAYKNGWYVAPPSSTIVSAGGDPGNPLLFSCKNLLRRVLAYMLTPMDLENMAASAVYTLSMDSAPLGGDAMNDMDMDCQLLPGSVTRIYLLRIIEELIVERIDSKKDSVDVNRAEQTRAFLSAFSGILRPLWFMSLLDKCRDEASTSAVFRLLVLMIQTCPSFLEAFIKEDSFRTLRLTIPKFSTSSSIILTLLGLLFHAPIWHLPCFATLQSAQLRDVFESEWDDIDLVNNEVSVAGSTFPVAQGALTILLDCIVRNIRLSGLDDRLGQMAVNINSAALSVIEVCLKRSLRFKDFSRTVGIFEPLINGICASIGAKKIREVNAGRKRAETEPSSSPPRNSLALEGKRVSSSAFLESELRLVSIMRLIVSELLLTKSTAASTLHVLFRAYPPLASVEEVEGVHSILIESCISAVQECILNATVVTLSNIVGLCSVFLERIRSGFFRHSDIIECVSLSTFVLNSVLSFMPKTMSTTLNESNMLLTDSLHIVRLMSLSALQRFRYSTITDPEMIPLQQKLSNIIVSNIRNMLTPFPLSVTSSLKKMLPEVPAYQIFQNTSIIRSKTSTRSSYPDVHAVEDPDKTFILVLLAEENFLLLQSNKEIREIALPVILILLRERRALMGELLRREYRKGENRSETIDLINRGGFGALLALIDAPVNSTDHSTPQLLNDAFFDWIDRNQVQVTPIFDSIRSEAYVRLPIFESNITQGADAAIEEEQRLMLDMQGHAEEEDVVLKGAERSRYLQQIYDQCSEYLSIWKRSGFSDIICGEFLWEKYSLQRKIDFSFEPNALILFDKSKDEAHGVPSESLIMDRFTLDLSEGFERQRRRLLPNHRFKTLYNVMDKESLFNGLLIELKEGVANISMEYKDEFNRPENDSVENVLQATAAILKVAKVSKDNDGDVSDSEINDVVDEVVIPIASFNQSSTVESTHTTDLNELLSSDHESVDKPEADKAELGTTDHDELSDLDYRKTLDSSLELVMGFLVDGDKPEKVFNVKRCIGLEIRKAILLWCSRAIYIIDGFEMNQGEGLAGRINRVEQYRTTFNVTLRQEENVEMANDPAAIFESDRVHDYADRKSKLQKFGRQTIFHHRAQRISFNDVHCIYRRRYQLRQVGLEFYDIHKTATLLAFDNQAKREEVLMSTLSARLPNSIFNAGIFGSTIALSYNKFMNNYRAKITNDWVSGKTSNFDFLMHLNTFAGRSYNDLTQYPVFPWVLADYESSTIDLNDPSIYRDLSLPMGAIGESRAKQFKDRYEALEMHYLDQDEHEQPPPFHYGTHYSCAAYVVNYLIRLDPFTRLALTLQGGKFDLADRLFQNVAASWRSASRDNLQDVRELIPEFFYLPDFLVNKNAFDYGVTQHGKVVNHVTLPPWAKGDPTRFVRIQRKV